MQFPNLEDQRWPAMTIQLAILTLAGGLLIGGKANGFIGFAIVVVLCTFALQTTSRRFLWLYPGRTFPIRINEVPHIKTLMTVKWDTHFLQAYLVAASVALAVGVYAFLIAERVKQGGFPDSTYIGTLNAALISVDTVLLGAMGFAISVLGVLAPLVFLIWWNRRIDHEIEREAEAWGRTLLEQAGVVGASQSTEDGPTDLDTQREPPPTED